MFIDTQILSYAYKGQALDIHGAKISSIVAHEFLEVYDKSSLTRFLYYIKYLRGSHSPAMTHFSPAQEKSVAIERLQLDFGNDHPRVIEFNSHATAAIINDRNSMAFTNITSTLSRKRKRKLRSQFSFLCDKQILCVPLLPETAKLGAQLLWQFTQKNNIKEGDFRNSINDMMVLAIAIAEREPLLTNDGPLSKFAATLPRAQLKDLGKEVVEVTFQEDKAVDDIYSRESKGYINRGWRIAADLRRYPVS